MVLSYITHNTTQGTAATVPVADTTITGATATIYPNSYKRIIITATITVKSSATATAQNNTYKIKIGSTAVDTLVIANTANGITGGLTTVQYVLQAVVEARAGGAVTVTHIGAAADAQVTSRFEDMIILGDS
jgi:ABC-type thiamin/hydroxymethylpyrimidine transport system permease subunit